MKFENIDKETQWASYCDCVAYWLSKMTNKPFYYVVNKTKCTFYFEIDGLQDKFYFDIELLRDILKIKHKECAKWILEAMGEMKPKKNF